MQLKTAPPRGPKFNNFVFVIQGTSVPNFKSLAQIVSEIRKMKYFVGHLGIEDSATWGQKFTNFVFVIQVTSVPNFKSVAQIVSEI